MLSDGRRRNFGRRKEPHRIIIAHGDVVQDFTVRPWIMSSVFGLGLVFSLLYLSATTYLVFRDEVISFSRAEQAQVQAAYEDRIAQLRSQLDRVASRQMIDQQAIETHVQHLMRKQADFEAYSSVLEPIIEKARKAGVAIRSELNVPIPRPAPWREKENLEASTKSAQVEQPKLAIASASNISAFQSPSHISGRFKELTQLGFRSSHSLDDTPDITGSIVVAEALPLGLEQPSILDTPAVAEGNQTVVKLADAANRLETEMLDSQVILHNLLNDLQRKSTRVEARIAKLGIKVPLPSSEKLSIGGPFIPVSSDIDHDRLAEDAEKVKLALDRFVQLKDQVYRLPISHPLPTGHLSSRFGIRRDPFLKRMSMHSGIDIADKYGTPIRSAGTGIVTHAGRKSGYGLMVEVNHGNGVVSRYAHMSKTLAKKGEKVTKGTIIGKVGSSGRSTGPHLHFETRVRNKPVNPYSFLIAGQELRRLI
ncbi:Murein DD-endopeptidase MepM and murein hydrolase activator NlpD, contain LysM domain [Cohaesibacter sp. ES.047]|uniref:M23 family metallopeptidase n=1 Tax=Cohaesibacter sp. ES.047 TaxID=1798205 RepID=UPI000BB77366|nr:M23 family metallopeptidase [Cohaesibacter sp. ES.047]SNY93780.1 Murein DD-endopeptidase MepM and murein hydrolase activator NlpD, contain LysM domain [Cohaesibacter sp. ES.047]